MARLHLPMWPNENEETRPSEPLVVVVVEYSADGHAIERERTTLPPQRFDIRHDPVAFAVSLRSGLPV